jgi:hypothetical protein
MSRNGGGSVDWMRNLLVPWLELGEWDRAEFIAWLEGRGIPAIGHDEEAYVWILRGLPLGADRYDAEKKLAKRAAEILRGQPDVARPGKRPKRVLYNLLLLCAGLGCPAELADPLYDMYARGKLQGEWNGQDLRACLRDALIENQADDRLLPLWERMRGAGGDSYLPGSVYDAFHGVRVKGTLNGNHVGPDIPAIAAALNGVALDIERSSRPRRTFRRWVDQVIETYPGRPSWHTDLIRSAHENGWPWWAVLYLPRLFAVLPGPDSGHASVLLWHYVERCLPVSSAYRIVSKLCEGQILEMLVPVDHVGRIRKIAERFEAVRIGNPYGSVQSIMGAATHLMADIEIRASETDPGVSAPLPQVGPHRLPFADK